jgi:hypothetical protein
MLGRLKHAVKELLSIDHKWPVEASRNEIETFEVIREFTGTSPERAFHLMRSVKYIVDNSIEGDFIECGVAKGGSAMLMASILFELGETNREIYLYDLFGARPHFMDLDREIESGVTVSEYYRAVDSGKKSAISNWTFYSKAVVVENLNKIPYPREKIHLIEGDVLRTLPLSTHSSIALLRLDTDFYESTKIELSLLYPKLSIGGVLILDDYGHWEGAKTAVDEYFKSTNASPLLHVVDSAARAAIKI